MKPYCEMTRAELETLKKELDAQFDQVKAKGLKLDMSRGKPSKEQLDLSRPMLDVINSDSDLDSENGQDCRNYGILDGIPEAKRLMAEMCQVSPEQVLIYGNSSLNLMFDTVSRAYTHGICGNTPWCRLDKVKFLCPVPGYDRHFGVTEHFGIEMIPVPMDSQGPDMKLVKELVESDDSVKGIWCVAEYANPSGMSYSDQVVEALASLKPAAADFRLYWDDAYTVHHLYGEERQDQVLEILAACEKAGNPDMVFKFASTSKITFPGSGVAVLATSKRNLEDALKHLKWQTIGHDKINQLRHVRFFKDLEGIKRHMEKHAAIMRPKFEAVEQVLEEQLGGLGIGSWTTPNGGYFISFDALEGCAKAIVARAKEAGVVMTGAGATWPYGKDPKDSNIRIAPSFPTPEELATAAEIFVLSVKLVSVEKFLALGK